MHRRKAVCARRLDDSAVDALDARPDHFRRAGCRSKAERNDSGGQRIDIDAEHREAEIEEEELYDERRVAEDVDIGDCQPAHRLRLRAAGKRQTEPHDQAEEDRRQRDDGGDYEAVD